MESKSRLRSARVDYALVLIAIVSAFLNVYRIWLDQTGNAYYTAAVTSMLKNFHAFFYGSLDSAGFVTVDKPPVTFWVQTAFASLFGVKGWSVILPQALAGVGSVLLLYVIVKPTFGRTSARLAALAMAVTPIAVAVARTNNVDALLVFTLLLAAWMLFKAVRSGKSGWLIGAFAIVGVAFNEKMLQAFMVLPSFYLLVLLAFKAGWKRKVGVLAAGTAVLAVVSLSWPLAVDWTSKESRPYIGSSQTNSVLELAFGYNGLSRLTGEGNGVPGGGGGRGPGNGDFGREQGGWSGQDGQGRSEFRADRTASSNADANALNAGDGSAGSGEAVDPNGTPPNGTPPNGTPPNGTPGDAVPTNNSMQGGGPGGFPGGMDGRNGGGGGGGFHIGTAGPLRLFQSELSGQISWLLPFTAVSALALLIGLRRRKPLTAKEKETLFWLAWLLPVMVFFSVAGFFHEYYLIMLAPPIAALAGAGWTQMLAYRLTRAGWKAWLLPVAIGATAALQLYILHPYRTQIGLGWSLAVGLGGFIAIAILTAPFWQTKLVRIGAVIGLATLLATPAYWSATPLLYGGNSHLPVAGPDLKSSSGQRGQGEGTAVDESLLSYLENNRNGSDYLFATTSVSTAERYIMATGGEAVMAMGGYSGNDPILTVDSLKSLVAAGKVKYFLLEGGGRMGGGSSAVSQWIEQNGKQIPQSDWQSGTTAKVSDGNADDSTTMNRNGKYQNGAGTLYEITAS